MKHISEYLEQYKKDLEKRTNQESVKKYDSIQNEDLTSVK